MCMNTIDKGRQEGGGRTKGAQPASNRDNTVIVNFNPNMRVR